MPDETWQPRCSSRHRGCTPEHMAMVEEYRLMRHAQEEHRDVMYGGTTEEWQEHTKGMITFKQWLIEYGEAQRRW